MSKEGKNATNFVERKTNAMYAKVDIWQNRIARLLFILMCCGVPLFLTPRTYLNLPSAKYVFFLVSFFLCLLMALIVWGYRSTRNPRLGPKDKLDIADIAILAFALVTILSTILSPFWEHMNILIGLQPLNGRTGRYDGAITQLAYIAMFFIISRWYKPRLKDFAWLSIVSIVISIIGILQFFGMDFLGLWPNHMPAHFRENFFDIHIRTTLGNTNTASLYLTLHVLVTGFLFIRKKSKWQPLWLASSGINFWMFLIAGADSGIVGMGVAMVFAIPFIIEGRKTLGRTLILAGTWSGAFVLHRFFFEVIALPVRDASSLLPFIGGVAVLAAVGWLLCFKAKEIEPNAAPKWKLGVVLIIVVIAAGFLGVEFLGRPDYDGIGSGVLYEAREILHGRIRDEFGTNRVYIWRIGLSVVEHNPLIGTGPDTFGFAFPFLYQFHFGQWYDNAHNEYIQYLVTHGIIGLIAYLVFALAVVVKSVRKAFSDPIMMAVLGAVVAYLAQAFFNISHPIASQLLWIFCGILMSRRCNEDGRFDWDEK